MRGAWQGPLLVGITLFTMASLWSLRNMTRAEAGGAWEMPPETVGIAAAEARPWRTSRTLLADLAPLASIEVRTEVPGRLSEVAFTSGQSVARGAVLARLDASVEEAELRAVEAELRALTLKRERVAAVADASATRMELDEATAAVDAAQARADALRASIRQKVLVAPFAGRTGVRTLHPGQVVAAGTLLTELVADSSTLYVDFWVPQTLLATVPTGAPVTVRLGEATASATIDVVEPSADATRRAVKVRARLDPAPPGWLPEMSAQVEVPTEVEAPRVVVPAPAIVWSAAGPLVYRVVPGEGAEKVSATPVRVLSDQGDEVVLESGLEPGARIVTEGAFKLHEGSAVTAGGK